MDDMYFLLINDLYVYKFYGIKLTEETKELNIKVLEKLESTYKDYIDKKLSEDEYISYVKLLNRNKDNEKDFIYYVKLLHIFNPCYCIDDIYHDKYNKFTYNHDDLKISVYAVYNENNVYNTDIYLTYSFIEYRTKSPESTDEYRFKIEADNEELKIQFEKLYNVTSKKYTVITDMELSLYNLLI